MPIGQSGFNKVSNLKQVLYKEREMMNAMFLVFYILGIHGFNHGIFGTVTGLTDPNTRPMRRFRTSDPEAYLERPSHAGYDDSESQFNLSSESSSSYYSSSSEQ
ncbi:hypothetical protein PAEPH01_2783 [Pancytospora epiphaga]|nr:hypothetical protein PAEPH01_2783 [Pancytospora epiphaga]